MSDAIAVMTRFYTAFQQKDAAGMSACCSPDIIFSDAVFPLLQGEQVTAMWRMLCRNARSFELQFHRLEALDDEYVTCHWQATYLFSGTGRMVTNRIKAHMRIQNGVITEHSDAFSFYAWAKQAFGWKGWLLGWSGFFRRKVQTGAREKLLQFMAAGQ
jgi:ketosteroid isomerase-like protein